MSGVKTVSCKGADCPKKEDILKESSSWVDFVNARNISNLINKVIRENPRMALLMISHCRIFPFITREIKLTATGVSKVLKHYECHSCFGN